MPIGNTRNRNIRRHNGDAGQAPRGLKRPPKANQNAGGSTRVANAKRSYERYLALANNCSANVDPVEIENFYQHAEHYFRLMNEHAREHDTV